MKKSLLTLASIVLAATLTTSICACSKSENEQTATSSKTVSYTVVNAEQIEASTADIIVMPVNSAAKLYGSGSEYVLLGTVTHGNLFILSRDDTALTASNLAEKLSGKTMGVMQLAKVPGLTTKIILEKYNATSSVTLMAMSAATEVSNTEMDYYVLPEPAATTMTKKNTDLHNVGSLQTLYGEDGYPQAVVVAKKSLIESDGAFVKEFIAAYKQTSTWLASLTDYSVIVDSINSHYGDSQSSLVVGQLSSTVIANCNISYTPASDDKTNIINYMNSVYAIDSSKYGECSDAFFQSESELNSLVSSTETITVAMPDGAPAVSMVYMMQNFTSVTL